MTDEDLLAACETLRETAQGYLAGQKNPSAMRAVRPTLQEIERGMLEPSGDAHLRECLSRLKTSIKDAFDRGSQARRPPGDAETWIERDISGLEQAIRARANSER